MNWMEFTNEELIGELIRRGEIPDTRTQARRPAASDDEGGR